MIINTQTINFVTYSIVHASSKQCNEYNELHKAEIEAGIEFPHRPTEQLLRNEREAEQFRKEENERQQIFRKGAIAFWEKVIPLLPTEIKDKAKISGVYLTIDGIFGADSQVELHNTSYNSYSRSSRNDKVLRIVVGDNGTGMISKKIKSTTQQITELHTEEATIQKVVVAVTEHYWFHKHRLQLIADRSKAEKNGRDVYENNRVVFDSVGVYSLVEIKPGQFKSNLTYTGTIEQWKELIALINSHSYKNP